ncbi:MAG: hypothetical protein HQL72_05785 [Magnetococcales bacterium]|nr:hypothetical protein [Magnetococcales bacterium]
MKRQTKIQLVVTLIGVVAGGFLGYAINRGLGADGLRNSHLWMMGGGAVAFIRVRMLSAMNHLL